MNFCYLSSFGWAKTGRVPFVDIYMLKETAPQKKSLLRLTTQTKLILSTVKNAWYVMFKNMFNERLGAAHFIK